MQKRRQTAFRGGRRGKDTLHLSSKENGSVMGEQHVAAAGRGAGCGVALGHHEELGRVERRRELRAPAKRTAARDPSPQGRREPRALDEDGGGRRMQQAGSDVVDLPDGYGGGGRRKVCPAAVVVESGGAEGGLRSVDAFACWREVFASSIATVDIRQSSFWHFCL
jgi:hypothetical protein